MKSFIKECKYNIKDYNLQIKTYKNSIEEMHKNIALEESKMEALLLLEKEYPDITTNCGNLMSHKINMTYSDIKLVDSGVSIIYLQMFTNKKYNDHVFTIYTNPLNVKLAKKEYLVNSTKISFYPIHDLDKNFKLGTYREAKKLLINWIQEEIEWMDHNNPDYKLRLDNRNLDPNIKNLLNFN